MQRVLGSILWYLSWPLMMTGAALFIVNLLLSASNIASKSTVQFVNALLLVGVGFLFRIIGDRLRHIRW